MLPYLQVKSGWRGHSEARGEPCPVLCIILEILQIAGEWVSCSGYLYDVLFIVWGLVILY